MMAAHNTPSDISRIINEMKSIPGVSACAVISKTGAVLGNYFQGNGTSSAVASLVGVMCATVISSAEGVASIINVEPPSHIVAHSRDATIIITNAGDAAYLIAILQDAREERSAVERLCAIAEWIGSVT